MCRVRKGEQRSPKPRARAEATEARGTGATQAAASLEILPGILAGQKGFLQVREIGLPTDQLKPHLFVPTI